MMTKDETNILSGYLLVLDFIVVIHFIVVLLNFIVVTQFTFRT